MVLTEVYHTLPVALRADPGCRIADECERRLRSAGIAVRRYAEGQALEADVRAGRAGCVVEMALADVAADPERLTAAALAGVPMVVAPVSLAADPRMADRLGRDVAMRASASRGPVTVLLGPGLPPEFGQSLRNWAGPNVVVRVVDDLAAAVTSGSGGHVQNDPLTP